MTAVQEKRSVFTVLSVTLETFTFPAPADETERPRGGDSADPPAVEPESLRRRRPALHVAMETPLANTDGHGVGLGAPSRTVEVLRHLGLPRSEELCLTVSSRLTLRCVRRSGRTAEFCRIGSRDVMSFLRVCAGNTSSTGPRGAWRWWPGQSTRKWRKSTTRSCCESTTSQTASWRTVNPITERQYETGSHTHTHTHVFLSAPTMWHQVRICPIQGPNYQTQSDPWHAFLYTLIIIVSNRLKSNVLYSASQDCRIKFSVCFTVFRPKVS